MFDINLFWINPGQTEGNNLLPGLIALAAPRRAARGREHDTLILLAGIDGSESSSGGSFNAWLYKKSEIFFQTAGTVTFAVKTFADALNKDLLERNLRRAKNGERMSASLSLAVLRRNMLYLVNFGAAKSWVAGAADAVEFTDTDNHGRGLGISEKIVCSFATREIAENDLLIFTYKPPEI